MDFDRGGLRSSLDQQCNNWPEVVYSLCHFSQLRLTWRGLPLVYCRHFSGQGIGSWISSRISHGRRDLVSPRCTSQARLDGWGWMGQGLCRERVNIVIENV